MNTVRAMTRLLKAGGICIWIAPAGGRDRRAADGTLTPDKFDPAAIEMMRKLGTKKGNPKTHYYPLAMATYDIMPPPVAREKSVGESRIVNFTGAGLSLGAELDVDVATASWARGLGEDADLPAVFAEVRVGAFPNPNAVYRPSLSARLVTTVPTTYFTSALFALTVHSYSTRETDFFPCNLFLCNRSTYGEPCTRSTS